MFVVLIFGTLTHILTRKDKKRHIASSLKILPFPTSTVTFVSIFTPKRPLGYPSTAEAVSGLQPPVLNWFYLGEFRSHNGGSPLRRKLLMNPVTSYSDNNYAEDGAKAADDAPSAWSSCLPVLQSTKSLVPIQQWPHAIFCYCLSHTRFPLAPLAWWLFNLLCK